ncbi:WD40 repeat-like protein [Paxillus ammoniavirescens]|nr:WD40 repeat-like protein [Paxillus ammoniavirescens]
MSNTSQKAADLTAKPLATLSGHKASIHGIAYLPGGKRVVICSFDKTVRIWDVEMGKQEGTSMVHEGRVYGLAVTRDGKRILSGGDDKKIRIWDAETHQLIEEWADQTRGIFCIALSPDDQLVASGHSSGKIEIRKVKESGEIKHSLDAGSWFTGVFSLCFSPSGEKLACAVNSWTGGVHDIKVYDVQSGELVLGPISGHEGNVCCVLWSLNGSQIFSASRDRTIRCWNSKTAEPIGEPWTGHRHPVMSLSLSPDGAELASVSLDKTLCLWDVHSGGLRIEPPSQHQHGIRAVAFSPSGEFVASGGNDHKVSIWSVPWWDETKKQAHGSLLDLPAVPVPMDRHQGEFDFLDLPLSRRSTTLSSRLPNCPTDSATAPIATRIHRFWRGLIVRSSSSPPWKTSELQHTHDRRFWKPAVRIPVTQVAAGQLTAVTRWQEHI